MKKTSALADDEDEAAEETQLWNVMESEEALNGSATRTKKCPFIWFSFMLSSGRPVPNRDGPAAVGQVRMFSRFDPDCFYPVDQRVVSQAVIDLKLVGAEPCTSFGHPNPIPIEDALSQKQGEHHVKWKPESNSIPLALAEKLWTESRGELYKLARRLNTN